MRFVLFKRSKKKRNVKTVEILAIGTWTFSCEVSPCEMRGRSVGKVCPPFKIPFYLDKLQDKLKSCHSSGSLKWGKKQKLTECTSSILYRPLVFDHVRLRPFPPTALLIFLLFILKKIALKCAVGMTLVAVVRGQVTYLHIKLHLSPRLSRDSLPPIGAMSVKFTWHWGRHVVPRHTNGGTVRQENSTIRKLEIVYFCGLF